MRWPKRWHQRHGVMNQRPRRVCPRGIVRAACGGSLPEWIAIPRVRTNDGVKRAIEVEMIATQEDAVSTDVLATRVADRIAVITLGSPKRIYFDAEMGDALTAALDEYAGDSHYSRRGSDGRCARRYFCLPLFAVTAPSCSSPSLSALPAVNGPDNSRLTRRARRFFDKARAICARLHAKTSRSPPFPEPVLAGA